MVDIRRDAEPSSDVTSTTALYKRDVLDTMHAYRDGVLGSRGAFVLYPGTETTERIFIRYPAQSTRNTLPPTQVSAFPLRPGNLSEQRSGLAAFLRALLADIASRAEYQEETGVRPLS